MIEKRSVGVFIATGLAQLAARCGGGSPTGSSGATSVSATACSLCMRGHGVPDFPDPEPNGRPMQVDAQQLGMSDALYQEAEYACLHLLPTGGSIEQRPHQCLLYVACPPALVQQLLTLERGYARCLRSHGAPNWPDPSISAKGGRPVFDLSAAGIDPQSTESSWFRSTDRECGRLGGGSVPTLPSREAFR